MLEKYYTIPICIIHTDFGKFNSDAAAEYFSQIGITCKLFEANAQQQIGIEKRYMHTVLKVVWAQMIDINFFIK